jgi:hypothetical protein
MKQQTKNRILLAAVVITLLVSYRFAIRNTFELREQYHQLSSQAVSVKDMPSRLALLKQKERYYDSVLTQMDLGDTSLQNNLLRVLNRESSKNDLKIIDFNQPHIYKTETNSLYTYSFGLNGGYPNILKTIHTLEQNGKFGEVVHIDFEKKKNYRSNKNYLEAKVLLQQVN